MFDSKLTFKAHIPQIISKTNGIYAIGHRFCVEPKTRLLSRF